MLISSKEKVTNVLHTPQGEIVYELVGRGDESGSVIQHSLAHVILPPGKSSPKHYHKESEETYYILKGVASMSIDQRQFSLSPGQVCLIEVGEVHQIHNQTTEDLEFLAVCAPAWQPGDSFVVDE